MAQGARLDRLRHTVARCLDDSGLAWTADAEQNFILTPSSLPGTFVWCIPRHLGTQDGTVVLILSTTNVGVRVDNELKCFLTGINNRQLFGKFVLHQVHPDVQYVHAVLGDNIKRLELETAVWAVASNAHLHAEEIKSRWGGRMYAEPAE